MTIPDFGHNPDIPVTFTHQEKEHHGVFTEVIGAGSYSWDLYINKFYWGQMKWVEISEAGLPVEPKDKKYGLRFYSQKGDLDYLGEYFCNTVMLFYESL